MCVWCRFCSGFLLLLKSLGAFLLSVRNSQNISSDVASAPLSCLLLWLYTCMLDVFTTFTCAKCLLGFLLYFPIFFLPPPALVWIFSYLPIFFSFVSNLRLNLSIEFLILYLFTVFNLQNFLLLFLSCSLLKFSILSSNFLNILISLILKSVSDKNGIFYRFIFSHFFSFVSCSFCMPAHFFFINSCFLKIKDMITYLKIISLIRAFIYHGKIHIKLKFTI